MSCRACKYDDEGQPICKVTGDRCMFMFPSEESCYETYAQGPLSYEKGKEE